MFEPRSALAAYARDGAPAMVIGPQLCISEVRGWHLAHLTAWRATREEFTHRLGDAFGSPPPEALYQGLSRGSARLIRLTSEQYWWVDTDPAALGRVHSALPPTCGAFTELTDARVRLSISGGSARDLLGAGIAIDLHPAMFPIGASAQTGLHHTGVLLERSAEDVFELFIPRTFAATIWEVLVDAALPHGVKPA